MSSSTRFVPKLLVTPWMRSTGVSVDGMCIGRLSFISGAPQRRPRYARRPIPRGRRGPNKAVSRREGSERYIIGRLNRARRMGQFGHRDDRQEGGVLDDLDDLVADHRRGRHHQRRQDDAAEQREAVRSRRQCRPAIELARQRLQAPRRISRHIGGVIEDNGGEAGAPVVEIDADRGQAVIDDVGEHQERNAAHGVDAAIARDPQRRRCAPSAPSRARAQQQRQRPSRCPTRSTVLARPLSSLSRIAPGRCEIPGS